MMRLRANGSAKTSVWRKRKEAANSAAVLVSEILDFSSSSLLTLVQAHLTSFALLLGASSGDSCDRGNFYSVQSWLGLSFIVLSIILFVIFAAIYEFKIQRRRKRIAMIVAASAELNASVIWNNPVGKAEWLGSPPNPPTEMVVFWVLSHKQPHQFAWRRGRFRCTF